MVNTSKQVVFWVDSCTCLCYSYVRVQRGIQWSVFQVCLGAQSAVDRVIAGIVRNYISQEKKLGCSLTRGIASTGSSRTKVRDFRYLA